MEKEKEKTQKKKERVELYQKYLKNKEIKELIKQKLNLLKSQKYILRVIKIFLNL